MAEPNRYQRAARKAMDQEMNSSRSMERPRKTPGPDPMPKLEKKPLPTHGPVLPPRTSNEGGEELYPWEEKPKVEGPKKPTYFEQKDEFGFDYEGPREAQDPVGIEKRIREKYFDSLVKSKKYDRDVARDFADAVDFKILEGLGSEEEKDIYLEDLLEDIRLGHPRG